MGGYVYPALVRQPELPQLHTAPVTAPPNQLEQMGQLMGIKGAQQEQQVRQQQLATGQIEQQGAQLGVEQQQQQLNDQKAMTSAMQQWDGKDMNDLAPLVIKNGGSANAVIGLKQKTLAMQQQYSTIAKNDADTGSTNLASLQKKNDMVAGQIGTIMQMPDEQIAQGLIQTSHSMMVQGLIDPQHAQMAQQMAMSGNPAQMRQQLGIMQKSYMAQSQQMDMALKGAQTQEAQSSAGKNQAESQYYQQNGGAPGVPAEMMQQADWLKKNPGKGPSDFKLWELQHTPMAMVMGNQLGGAANAQAMDFAAQNYRQTRQMPPGLYPSPGTIAAIIKRAAELDQQAGGNGLADNSAEFAANKASLASLQKNYDQVEAFEQTAGKNMDLLSQTMQKIPDLGARWSNIPVRMLSAKMLGTDNMAAFNTALNTAQTEAAKVLNSSNASGVLSDSARHELQTIIDPNSPVSAIQTSIRTLKQDMGNRTQAYQLQIADIQNRIKGAGRPAAPGSGAAAAPPQGATHIVRGPDGRNHYTNAGGTVDYGVAQ